MAEQCNKQWNSIGGTVWGHSGTVRWNSVVEQWNSDGGMEWCDETVWWNNRTVMVEQWDIGGGTV